MRPYTSALLNHGYRRHGNGIDHAGMLRGGLAFGSGSLLLVAMALTGCGDKELAKELKDLNDPSAQTRESAVIHMRELGPRAHLAIPKIVERLKDTEAKVRKATIETLVGLGDKSKETVPTLIADLAGLSTQDPDLDVKIAAASALAYFKARKEAAAAYASLLEGPPTEVRRNACMQLAQLGKEASVATDVLVKATRDKDDDIRMYASETLGNIGDEAKSAGAIPALQLATRDKNPHVQRVAKEALEKLK
jgi:HEAT repeat protein